MTKQQEIDAAYAQAKAQEQKDKNAAWERAESELNKGKDL
jgi:hypothetical protein